MAVRMRPIDPDPFCGRLPTYPTTHWEYAPFEQEEEEEGEGEEEEEKP